MKAVKFLMAHTVGTLYAPDEMATFEDAVADDLIDRKIAEEVKMKGKSSKTKKPELTDEEKAAALAAKAKKDLEAMTVPDLDKIIADEEIKDVAADANKAAKVEAIIAARAVAANQE